MNLQQIRKRFESGQEIFRRPTVELLLKRIDELERIVVTSSAKCENEACQLPATHHHCDDCLGELRHAAYCDGASTQSEKDNA